jgi:hypothetical protein
MLGWRGNASEFREEAARHDEIRPELDLEPCAWRDDHAQGGQTPTCGSRCAGLASERTSLVEYDRLTIRLERSATTAQYDVLVEGRAGEGHGRFDLPFDTRDIEYFALRMSRGRRVTRRIETSDTRQAKEFGGHLFAALFQGEVRDVYRACLADARAADRGLRLTMALTRVPELMDLPWEYLYDEPEFLAVSAWTPVVRYLDVAKPRAPLKVDPPLRVLGMISDAADLVALDVQEERRGLEEALRPLTRSGRVEVHWTRAATLESLLRKLRAGAFHIFHFVGHGAYDANRGDGLLLLKGEDGRSVEITGEDLGMILNDHHSLRLAVLNACEGARASRTDPFAGIAASLVQRGTPAVVAMQFEISDVAAVTFAKHFYEALALGYPVDAAVAQARQGIFASGNDVEWGTPVLFLRPVDGRVFDVRWDDARSEEARLSVSLEARPATAAAGEPVVWSLHVQNVGRPSLFSTMPLDNARRPLGDPVDLLSGEDTLFTWSSAAQVQTTTSVTVIASEANGHEVRATADGRLEVHSAQPTMTVELRAQPARVLRGDDVLWRLIVHATEGSLFDVVVEDETQRRWAEVEVVSAGQQHEAHWSSPAERTEDLRVLVRACDSYGRSVSAWASATVSVVEPPPEAVEPEPDVLERDALEPEGFEPEPVERQPDHALRRFATPRAAMATLGRHRAALPAIVAVLCAIVGYLVAPARSGKAAPANFAHSASSAAVSLEYPAGFRLARIQPALRLSSAVVLARGGGAGEIVAAGRTNATGPTLLPANLTSRLPRRPTPARVRLGALQALRYDDLRPAGSTMALRVYAVATSARVTDVVCAASPAALRALTPVCERIAQTLRLRGARGLPVGPSARYAAEVTRTLRDVSSGRAAAVGHMRAGTRAVQATAARAAARVYEQSAHTLASMNVSPYDEGANAALASALASTQDAYERLAAAAHAGRRSRYAAARTSVGTAERAAMQSIYRLGRLGYAVER